MSKDRLSNNTEGLVKREEALEKEKKKQLQLANDRAQLMTDPRFQRVMADILTKGGMFRSVMTGNSQTYWLSGRQDFAREIWADMAKADNHLAFELLKPKFGEQDG